MKSLLRVLICSALLLPALASAQQQDGPAEQTAAKKAAAPEKGVKAPVKAGDTVPMFALKEFGGNFVFLKRYCGKSKKNTAVKAVLLDFFATTCAPCVARLPALQALAGQYAAKGLETFLISVDPKPEDVLPAFLKKKEVSLPILTDMYQKTLSNYGFSDVPQTVLIDEDCKAIYVEKPEDKDYSAIIKHLDILLK